MRGVRQRRKYGRFAGKSAFVHGSDDDCPHITDEAKIFLARMLAAIRKLDSDTDSEIARLTMAPLPSEMKFQLMEAAHRKRQRRMQRLMRLFGRSKWGWLKQACIPRRRWRV